MTVDFHTISKNQGQKEVSYKRFVYYLKIPTASMTTQGNRNAGSETIASSSKNQKVTLPDLNIGLDCDNNGIEIILVRIYIIYIYLIYNIYAWRLNINVYTTSDAGEEDEEEEQVNNEPTPLTTGSNIDMNIIKVQLLLQQLFFTLIFRLFFYRIL